MSKYAILKFYINWTPLGLHTLRSDIHTRQCYAHGPPKVHALFTLYKNSRLSVTTVSCFIASSHIQPKSITTCNSRVNLRRLTHDSWLLWMGRSRQVFLLLLQSYYIILIFYADKLDCFLLFAKDLNLFFSLFF